MNSSHLTLILLGFFIFGVLALMLYSRNLIHITYLFLAILLLGGVWFMICGLHTAAASQIMIYAGGVLIVMLFGVMLTHSYTKVEQHTTVSMRRKSVFFWLLTTTIFAWLVIRYPINIVPNTEKPDLTGKNLAALWMHAQLVPFELSAVMLLVCLIGAVYLAGQTKKSKQ